MEEPDLEREQVTPVQMHIFVLELQLSPTKLERLIMMVTCSFSGGREDGTSMVATDSW
jgi:hypothetical protein